MAGQWQDRSQDMRGGAMNKAEAVQRLEQLVGIVQSMPEDLDVMPSSLFFDLRISLDSFKNIFAGRDVMVEPGKGCVHYVAFYAKPNDVVGVNVVAVESETIPVKLPCNQNDTA
tara:strand:+ start:986 stop:1327 length:342 start_codon:yes stop_codon:yes gene_type:complete